MMAPSIDPLSPHHSSSPEPLSDGTDEWNLAVGLKKRLISDHGGEKLFDEGENLLYLNFKQTGSVSNVSSLLGGHV